ncbi:MAG: hypothetical protein HY318_09345 [Armatimonadetes bacterium]|nr:hypothetical protein [Armatimonadota bacterium]
MGTLWNLAVAQDTRQFLDFEAADKLTHELKAELRSLARQPVAAATNPWDHELAQSVSSLRGELSSLGYGIDDVVDVIGDLRTDLNKGIMGLGALFEWGMTKTIGLLEENQTAIYETRDLLKYPKRTAANEERENAQLALRNAGNSEEDSEREHWLEYGLKFYATSAENYPFDYTVHLDMGKLLLLECNKPEESLPSFRKAARTAQTSGDVEFESKAHFFAGRAQALLGNCEEAYKETSRALELQPDSQLLAYECARYCALTGRMEECSKHVESIVRANAIGGRVTLAEAEAWWAKVQSDDDFNPMEGTLEELLRKLAGDANSRLQNLSAYARQAMGTATKSENMVACIVVPATANLVLLNDRLSELVNFDSLSYFQYFAAIHHAGELVRSAMNEAKMSLTLGISKLNQLISEAEQRMCAEIEEVKQRTQETIDQLVSRKKEIDDHGSALFGLFMSLLMFGGIGAAFSGRGFAMFGWILGLWLVFVLITAGHARSRKSLLDSEMQNLKRMVHKPDDSTVTEMNQLRAKMQELERALSRVESGGFL